MRSVQPILILVSDSNAYGGNGQVQRRRAFADAARGVVLAAVARAEPAAPLAAHVGGLVAERDAAEMGADADQHDPLIVPGLDPRLVGLRIAQFVQLHVARLGDFLVGAMADEDRLALPHHGDARPERDRREVDLHRRTPRARPPPGSSRRSAPTRCRRRRSRRRRRRSVPAGRVWCHQPDGRGRWRRTISAIFPSYSPVGATGTVIDPASARQDAPAGSIAGRRAWLTTDRPAWTVRSERAQFRGAFYLPQHAQGARRTMTWDFRCTPLGWSTSGRILTGRWEQAPMTLKPHETVTKTPHEMARETKTPHAAMREPARLWFEALARPTVRRVRGDRARFQRGTRFRQPLRSGRGRDRGDGRTR